MKNTFKDFVARQIFDRGYEDHNGDYYRFCEIWDRFDDFLEDIEKEELIAWADEFAATESVLDKNGMIIEKIQENKVDTSKWIDAIIDSC